MAPVPYIYFVTAWFGSVIHTSAAGENFVRPSEFENQTCQFHPCLPLDDYVREADQYFVDDTIFIFLPGTHQLNVSLDLKGKSNITLLVRDDEESRDDVSLVFSPLINITWTSCSDIEISGLRIHLSGREISDDHSDFFFASLVFNSTSGSLSRLTILGNETMFSTAIYLTDSSSIKISDVMVLGAQSMKGAALYAINSTVDIFGQNSFIRNNATNRGGAIALCNCICNISGKTSFANNSAKWGGAMTSYGGSHIIYGDVSFVGNVATSDGGALDLISGWYCISGKVSFMNNSAFNGGAVSIYGQDTNITLDNVAFISNYASFAGGAMTLDNGEHNISGNFSFMNNYAHGDGGAIASVFGKNIIQLSGNILFENNTSDRYGGAVIFNDDTHMSGTISFINNTAKYGGGALSLSPYSTGTHSIFGTISFIGNNAPNGGAVRSANGATHNISGNVSFINNTCTEFVSSGFGGAIAAFSSNIELAGKVLFEGNMADFGGAIYMEDGVANVCGTQQFVQNFAKQGGTMAFSGTSKVILTNPLTIDFTENWAMSYGGVIFVDDTTNYDNQCSGNTTNIERWPTEVKECFFELSDYLTSDIHLNFINNTAGQAGKILYGGSIDKCKLYIKKGTVDICGKRQGGEYDFEPISKLQNISSIVSVDDDISDISSDPLEVCFCGKNDTEIQCTDQRVNIVRGEELTLKAVIVGQSKGIVPSAVRIQLNNSVEIDKTQYIQITTNECTEIKYRIFSNESTTTLVLFPQDSPCRDSGISRRKIEVTFDPCPDAFGLQEYECVCDKRLQKYTNNCSVDDKSITRSSNTFWMGVDYCNSTFKGLILHDPGCPLDYCVDTPISITLDNLDVQCNHNHAGLLCGSCKENYSIVFGTVHCRLCNNAFLALVLPFSLAGIALVAVLYLLKISIANGTINGLIFYANIVQANRSIFFPLGKTNPLTIFIVWLNLDLGIETCFYDGMNAYGFTWLQFVFPFYVWFLIGVIIVVTHYSQRATSMFGTNPVAALATLLLLSYSKLLRTVIMALSVTSLEYPGYIYKKVWLYDGKVPYFGNAEHIILGLFAILVLVLLFLPYTLLLLCGHWLQACSHWKVFSWVNKLKPILDAYHAPYKKETRYWTGLLLVVRCILLLVFGLNAFGNTNVNLLAITTFTACLPALALLHKGIYKTAYNNILETSFILNLCIFSAATYHLKEIGRDQAALAYTSVGIAFFTFLLIVLCRLYLALRKTSVGKNLPSLNFIAQNISAEFNKLIKWRAEHDNEPNGGKGEQHNLANQAPTTSFIDIREYEPLLDSK